MLDAYAKNVLTNDKLRQILPANVYEEFEHCTTFGLDLSPTLADVIANAMKDWAIANGATHFSHWFQPLNNMTAQKHDSFIASQDGRTILRLSGAELIKGEPDASSFPTGGLRSTFEARGYTVWDPLSPAFIRDGVLYIPSSFCSFGGEALDKKTPLLKSIDAINTYGMALMRALDMPVDNITVNVGAEQEYFLIDKAMYEKRRDLQYTGRTLFGLAPPKCQQMQRHYLGRITPRILKYMQDLDSELWKLGIPSKTRHNEVAPCQHELAPLYTSANLACDQNQLTMGVMKDVADKNGLVCLLNEKPFSCVNGSGKHINWSLETSCGNMFESGKNLQSNRVFLLAVCAIICAVDTHQDLLRASCATFANDLRLGANEAPPAIVSVYLGKQLHDTLLNIATDATQHKNSVDIAKLAKFTADCVDRNRTSPIAFTSNKFELRFCGAGQCIADVCTILNLITAQQFDEFATLLSKATDKTACVKNIVSDTIKNHEKVVYDGNNYSKEWTDTAKARGLENNQTTPKALACIVKEKNVALFEKYNILQRSELASRQTIRLQEYCLTAKVESSTCLDIAYKDILPCVLNFKAHLANNIKACKEVGIDVGCESELATHIEHIADKIFDCHKLLTMAVDIAECTKDLQERATAYSEKVLPKMNALRSACDEAESIVPSNLWCMPTLASIFSFDNL